MAETGGSARASDRCLTWRNFLVIYATRSDAGWSSLVARRAHNPKVIGSNPVPATNILEAGQYLTDLPLFVACGKDHL